MGFGTGQMARFVEFGVVFEAVLDGADDDGAGVDLPVGFGHDAAVEGAGGVLRGSAVVLHRLFHGLELFRREEVFQEGIGQEDLTRVDVVVFAAVHDAQVVIGGDDIDHIGIHVDALAGQHIGEGGALTDHGLDMIELVGLVEMGVAGQDLRFDISG